MHVYVCVYMCLASYITDLQDLHAALISRNKKADSPAVRINFSTAATITFLSVNLDHSLYLYHGQL